MNFNELPKFTQSCGYNVHVDWRYLEEHLEHWGTRSVKGSDMAAVDLDPAFQRAHVWTEDQQRRYVEYILKGGQSGRDLYFNCAGWGYNYKGLFVLVDGKQRLEAVRKFLRSELGVFREISDEKPLGYLYSELEGRPFWCQFNFHVNNLSTMGEVYQWYIELNEGGTPHTDSEIEKVRIMLQEEKQKKLSDASKIKRIKSNHCNIFKSRLLL